MGPVPDGRQVTLQTGRSSPREANPRRGAQLRADHALETPKVPRYYQRLAVNKAVEAIGRGKDRVLLVLATGTGKALADASACERSSTGWRVRLCHGITTTNF
ncbi:DEAD/DEAH box helicase family protein [Nonomuraea sp. NPDC002799]